jgi:hypothetical protein
VVGAFFANLIGLTLCFLFNMDFKLLDLTTNISFPIFNYLYIPVIVRFVSAVVALIFNFVVTK